MKIRLTNIRGFEGTHEVNIRPITVLLGENSSGKTTLLASIYAALNRDFPTTENVFNRAPFDLGSFDTIATYRGGKYGRASSFSLGWEITQSSSGAPRGIHATFRSAGGTPRLDSFKATDGRNEINATATSKGLEVEVIAVRSPRSKNIPKPVSSKFTIPDDKRSKTFRFQDLFRHFFDTLSVDGTITVSERESRVIDVLQTMTAQLPRLVPHVTALSPLRTRPRRTYDELNDEFKPEGDHVPLVLARMLAGKQKESIPELDALVKYGIASGLFERIDVKRLGKQPSDPFQVRVKMKGPEANLVDVGYGVSQALPIIVDSLTAPNGEILLIQQPEVHLHPKAQAALGTFFAELISTSKKQFVVETHSDYLVDRLRLAVADGVVKHTDVQLLYLERKGLDIDVHHLELDTVGNIVNAPPGYRKFFLQEELKLMTRAA